MRKFAVAASLSLFATSSVLAALPPRYQRQAELIAILNEPDVVNALAPNAIDSIQMIAPDHFEVRGGGCTLEVRLVDLEGDFPPGPRHIDVDVGELSCPENGD
jgi:hypothetical protein